MQLRFVGCGDAFGSGGRFNTCFHVTGEASNFLIDCGASSLISMKALAIDRNAIDTILITHFHADHFGGLPFFLLDAQFFSKRRAQLTIAGPTGLEEWLMKSMEVAFPGSSKTAQAFELNLVEVKPTQSITLGPLTVTPFQALHGPPDGPFVSYRVEAEDKVVAYTGDSQWTEGIAKAAHQADLFVAEAYFKDKHIPLHLDLATLEAHLPEIGAKRVVLTHMSDDMLSQLDTTRPAAAAAKPPNRTISRLSQE